MQFNIRQSVHTINKKKPKVPLAKSAVWGVDKFHFKVILEFCYKVDVTTAYLGDVKLAYSHEDGDQ